MAVYSIVLSVGFMAAFPLVGWLVQAWGWRARLVRRRLRPGRRPRTAELADRPPLPRRRRPRAGRRRSHPPSRRSGYGGQDRGQARRAVIPGARRSRRRRSGCLRSGPRSTASSRRASACSTNRSSRSAASAPRVYYQTLGVTAITALARQFPGRLARGTRAADRAAGAVALHPDDRPGRAAARDGARARHAVGRRDGDRRRDRDGALLQRLAARVRPASPGPDPGIGAGAHRARLRRRTAAARVVRRVDRQLPGHVPHPRGRDRLRRRRGAPRSRCLRRQKDDDQGFAAACPRRRPAFPVRAGRHDYRRPHRRRHRRRAPRTGNVRIEGDRIAAVGDVAPARR